MKKMNAAALLTSASLLCLSSNAQAAEESPQTSSNDRYTEIIVTATKRSETVQRVPGAITALSGEALSERGITTTDDLKFLVPSIQVGELQGNTNINIRGVGMNLVSTVAPPGVAVHIDGVYQPIVSMGDLAQIDLERIEVLRGPQGTLYGRNANAGAVNFISKAPTGSFEGYLKAGYATYNQSRLQGVINIPLGSKVAVRAVGDWVKRRDGFYKNVVPGNPDLVKGQTGSGRVRLAADISDVLNLDLSVAHLQASGPYYAFVNFTFPNADALSRNPFLNNAIVPGTFNRTSANNFSDTRRRYTMANGTLNLDLGEISLKSITAYQHLYDRINADDDGTNLDGFLVLRRSWNRTWTQEFNLTGQVGPVSGVLGAFYMHDDYENIVDYSFPLGLFPLPAGSRLYYSSPATITKALGLFGDFTLSVSDRFRLIGGLRYSNDKISATQYHFLRRGPLPNANIVTCPNLDTKLEFNSTTPRFGAQLDLSDQSNAYATWSKGFKDGGVNRTQCAVSFNPEKITSYEVGFKNKLLDNRLTANFTAFYYDYSDLQLVQQIGLGNRITNAARARVKGAEAEFVFLPTDNLTLNANFAFLDAEYRSFTNRDNLNTTLGFQDLKGNRLNNAPKFSTNFGVAYKTDASDHGQFTARVDGSYRTRFYFREFNLPEDSQPAFAIFNASLIWDSPEQRYQVRIYGTNIFNQGYKTTLAGNDAFGSRNGTWGAPSQFGVEFRYTF